MHPNGSPILLNQLCDTRMLFIVRVQQGEGQRHIVLDTRLAFSRQGVTRRLENGDGSIRVIIGVCHAFIVSPGSRQDGAVGHDGLSLQQGIDHVLAVKAHQQRFADLLILEVGQIGIVQVQEHHRQARHPAGVDGQIGVIQRLREDIGRDLADAQHFPILISLESRRTIGIIAENDLLHKCRFCIIVFRNRQNHTGDRTALHHQMVELIRACTHRRQIEAIGRQLVSRDSFEQVLGQDAKGQVIQERHIRFRQDELDVLVVETGNLHLVPHGTHVRRVSRIFRPQQAQGEEHIIARDPRSIVPVGIGADGNVVNRSIGGDAPRFGQVGPGGAIGVETNQPAEEQAVDIAVGGIVEIEQRIQTPEGTDQGLGIDPPAGRFGQDRCGRRLLRQQEHAHHHQRQNNDQDLPAQFFHRHSLSPGRQRKRERWILRAWDVKGKGNKIKKGRNRRIMQPVRTFLLNRQN